MAKDKEPVEKITEIKAEKYKVLNRVLDEGYYAKIDGKEIQIAPGEFKVVTVEGKKRKQRIHGSVMIIENKQWKETGKDYFEDLTPLQVHELVQAGVITLTTEQAEAYKKWQAEVLYKKAK